jgi:hypothetical protein
MDKDVIPLVPEPALLVSTVAQPHEAEGVRCEPEAKLSGGISQQFCPQRSTQPTEQRAEQLGKQFPGLSGEQLTELPRKESAEQSVEQRTGQPGT